MEEARHFTNMFFEIRPCCVEASPKKMCLVLHFNVREPIVLVVLVFVNGKDISMLIYSFKVFRGRRISQCEKR